MLTDKKGEAAAREIEEWANRIATRLDDGLKVNVYDESDSSTYVLRLAEGARVLIFRLSESQVRTDGREAECERTLNRKIHDLWNLI
jgi:RNase H-fold protein (predicted Holliday junction resolvase)